VRTSIRFTYISDVSRIPQRVMEALQAGPQIRVLVLDCLNYPGQHFSHFGLLPTPALPAGVCMRADFRVHARALRIRFPGPVCIAQDRSSRSRVLLSPLSDCRGNVATGLPEAIEAARAIRPLRVSRP
jgi:hypothetical protein